jgi:nitrogen fixation NifU-like protein
VLLDHVKRPRNFGRLERPDRVAKGDNPLCGDNITVHLDLEGDRIADVRFEGSGCAISTASASMMTEAVTGKTVAEAQALFDGVVGMLTQGGDPKAAGKLVVLEGVRDYPVRVKCATLAWHTLKAALKGKDQAVSTE